MINHQLTSSFSSETTEWILLRAKGIDYDSVSDRALPKQLGCSKTFSGEHLLTSSHFTSGKVLFWLTELAGEVVTRMKIDMETNLRKPRLLHCSFGFKVTTDEDTTKKSEKWPPPSSSSYWEDYLSLSKQTKLPSFSSLATIPSAEIIAKLALSLIQKCLNENPRVQQQILAINQFNQQQSESSNNGSSAGGVVSKQWGISTLGLSACQFEPLSNGIQSISSFFTKQKEKEEVLPLDCEADVSIPLPLENESSSKEVNKRKFEDLDQIVIEEDDGIVSLLNDDNDGGDSLSNFSVAVENTLNPSSNSNGNSSSDAVSSFDEKTKALYQKYVRSSVDGCDIIDYDTFVSLPSDIQTEVINQMMFTKHFNPSTTSSLKKSTKVVNKGPSNNRIVKNGVDKWMKQF
jgi:hypothetical protein